MSEESFMKSLFGGVVAENLIFPFPEPSRSEADQVHVVLESWRKFAEKGIDAAAIDRDERIDPALHGALGQLGILGLLVAKDRGGSGMSRAGYARVVQEIASVDLSVALLVSAHESLGIEALTLFGTDDLKAKWLPRLTKGALCAFALAEPGAGSDAGSIQTRAEVEDGDYLIRGEKTWVTNGQDAELFIVFARTSPAEDGAKPKLTAFAVERSARVIVGPADPTLGVRGLAACSLTFDSARGYVLGEVGRGFKVAMEVLTNARLSLATACVGLSKKFVELAVHRAQERRAFGRTISEFGFIRDKIATMSADIFALESAAYLTLGLADQGRADFTIESAIGKVLGSEILWRVANEAQQIAGGTGYMRNLPWERLLRDARVPMVFEGTNEILRAFIALSGAQGPSREIEEVGKAMREPIKGFGLLSDFALKKAKSALGRERLTRAHPVLAREAVLFEEYTGLLAKNVDKILRRHGKNIAEMQYAQKRAADVAIDLYAIAAVLSRTTRAIERRGEEGARREIDLTTVFVSSAKKRLADNCAAFDENDDELRKAIATKTCSDGGYPLDVI